MEHIASRMHAKEADKTNNIHQIQTPPSEPDPENEEKNILSRGYEAIANHIEETAAKAETNLQIILFAAIAMGFGLWLLSKQK